MLRKILETSPHWSRYDKAWGHWGHHDRRHGHDRHHLHRDPLLAHVDQEDALQCGGSANYQWSTFDIFFFSIHQMLCRGFWILVLGQVMKFYLSQCCHRKI